MWLFKNFTRGLGCDLKSLMTNIGLMRVQLWSQFEPTFKDKNVLSQRFSQLAELRNRLRHSRSVDAISKKEGEASILWFEKVLWGG